MVAMRRHPQTELQLWASFPPGTHEQVVKLWTELLRRQLGIPGPAENGGVQTESKTGEISGLS